MIQKNLLFLCSGFVGALSHELQGDANADHKIRQRKCGENQGDQHGEILAAKDVGNPGGKQIEYNQKPELGIPWLIES